MIHDGDEGYLCRTPAAMGTAAAALAENEPLRINMADLARSRVEDELADPKMIFSLWQKLFSSLS
jgi:hypothetical protein